MQGLLDKVKGEKNVSKLAALADDMEKLDIEIERISPKNLHKASIKQLHSLARKHKINVPKGTTKTGIKRLLAGEQDIVQTESGYAVRNLLSKGKAGTAWQVDRYATRAEALEVFHNQQVAIHEAVGRGYGQTKPRVQVAAEVGRTTDLTGKAPLAAGLPPVTGPGATSIEETTKTLVKWSKKAKPLNKTERAAAVKANQQRQTAAGMSTARRNILKGHSAHDSVIKAMRAMTGEADIPKVTPPNLSTAQWEAIERKAIERWPTAHDWFKIPQTWRIIDKLKGGNIPTDTEFGVLEELIGRKAVLALHKGIVTPYEYSWADTPWLTRDILKMTFAYDPQASPLRQTSGIVGRHPLVGEKALDVNIRAYAGERIKPTRLLRRLSRKIRGKETTKFEPGKVAAERIQAEIKAHPTYELSKKYVTYLSDDPWASKEAGTKLHQYGRAGDFLQQIKGNNPASKLLRKWGQWISASERGANAGMNTATQLMWIEGEKDLARDLARKAMTPAQIHQWRVNRGRDIMTGLKRRTAITKQGRQLQQAANWFLFSPTNTWSRLIHPFQVIKRLAKGKGYERTYAAELMVSNIAKISAMGAIAAYTGHRLRANDPTEEPYIDGSNDPTNNLWGKTRVGNDVYDPTGGDASTLRMFARLGTSAYMYGREWFTDKEGTAPSAGETTDALLKAFPIEFVISVVEAGTADGTWEQLVSGDIQEASKGFIGNLPVAAFGLLGGGTGSYPVKAAYTRHRFKDIIAQKEYDKDWDDLAIADQRKLMRDHREEFETLDRRVAAERVKDPYKAERQKEEARLSQEKISGLLSKSNRKKVADFSVAVSRRPKNFYLNDERYQKYQELTAKYLNERLSVRNLEGRSQRTQDILLELDITLAKDKAFRELIKK
jgi:hypothetical protein